MTELEPREDMSRRTRDGRGQFTRDLITAERDARAAALRVRGLTLQAIADELGFKSQTSAHDAIKRALEATVQTPAADMRELELQRLDAMQRAVQAVLEREHVSISQGRVVRRRTDEVGDDGEPVYEDVLDDGPILQAVDRLLKIQERRAKLLGLDAAAKVDLSGGVRYEVVGIDPADLK